MPIPSLPVHSALTAAFVAATALLATAHAGPAQNDPHRGGKMRLLATASPGTIDPHVNYTIQGAQVFQATYDNLVAYRKGAGADAFAVVPDLAEAIPQPTDGGKTYVFKIRRGIRFSDGRELGVDDVVASLRRIFKVLSPTAGTFYNGIVGADACMKTPATCTLAGGVTADAKAGTVTIRLVKPDAEFLFKLAHTHAIIVPADAPPRDVGVVPIPGTGPYRIAAYDPKKQLKLVRNPHFKEWSAEAQPDGYVDELDFDFGLSANDQVTAIANGQADWMFDPVPAGRLNELGTKYAKQVKVSPLTALYYVAMNTRLAPFDNAKVRQAVNLAIDRNALVKLFGGANLATPTCQVLPPRLPGHEPYCPWTKNPGAAWSAPDLDRARALVKDSGTAGQKVTLFVDDGDVTRQMGTYLQNVLKTLGYDAAVKVLSGTIHFTYIQNTNNKVQISLTTWYQDYPAPSNFLNVLFSCASFRPGSDASVNVSGWCDKTLDDDMAKALATGVSDPTAAARQWTAIDRRVTDDAVIAPLINPGHLDFVSRRVGNFTFSGQFHFLWNLAWVK
jgi:peptide/nickel transport system substrate-binding protein